MLLWSIVWTNYSLNLLFTINLLSAMDQFYFIFSWFPVGLLTPGWKSLRNLWCSLGGGGVWGGQRPQWGIMLQSLVLSKATIFSRISDICSLKMSCNSKRSLGPTVGWHPWFWNKDTHTYTHRDTDRQTDRIPLLIICGHSNHIDAWKVDVTS